MSRIQVRDGFLVLMAALWCADESGVLPLFLLAAAVHECGHLFVIRLSGGTVHALCLTACGAVLRCSLPPSPFSRAAICLAGPAASFALTALANPLGAYRLAGASALLGLFNLLPIPPLDGGMALRHLADGRFTRLLNGIAGVSVLVLLAGGVLLWKSGFGGWLLLVGIMITGSAFRRGADLGAPHATRMHARNRRANHVRPQHVRFYIVREHTALPCGIIVADEAAPECPALR